MPTPKCTDNSKICRLCMTNKELQNLYTNDLSMKLLSCLNLKIELDDGLPLFICKSCERRINKFHKFKLKCLKVDAKLRCSQLDQNKTHTTVKYEFDSKILNDTFDLWLDIENKPHVKEIIQVTKEVNSTLFTTENPECNDDDKSDTGVYILQDNTVNKQHVYQCELCGNFFKSKSVLENHLRSHTGVKLFCCKLCPKRFSRAEHKSVHMRAHMGIKPYICEICGRSSTKRQDLIRHLLIHSDEKKYSCSSCGKQFKRSSDVLIHMRTHTGARPYKCSNCDKCYTSHSGLRKHHKTYCKT